MNENIKKLAQFIEVPSAESWLKIICQWVEMCYCNAETVALRLKDAPLGKRLDDMLWAFDDMSFLPHAVIDESCSSDSAIEPILIVSQDEKLPNYDVLIEATARETCKYFKNYPHIIDFVYMYDERLKQASRQRYTDYKKAGYQMKMVKK